MKRFLVVASLLVSTVSLSFAQSPHAYASTVGFKAGEIMSDAVMSNSKSMSVTQIQNFLNAKVPSCDTNGTQNSEMNNSGVPDYNGNGSIQRWEWGKKKYNQTKFVCLKNYSKDGKSGAKIIYDAAQTYDINPQSLIVLLQKEQGLVTDTWPLNIQYRSATGYGCPDTAPCDSQYYGLTNQVKWAARMFRSIMNQDPDWYSPYVKGVNARVYWHPDTARCGYAPLNIVNWTTASLYSYTPYRPNQAALDAGFGTGNSCSSYGNRNFYSYFTDWFGSTRVAAVFRTSTSTKTYLLSGAKYFYVPSAKLLEAYGFTKSDVKVISTSTMSQLASGGTLKNVARFGGPEIYLIDSGRRTHFPGPSMLASYGFSIGDEVDIDASVLNHLPSNGAVSDIVNRKSDNVKFYIEAGKRRHISGKTAYETLGTPTYASRATTTLDEFVEQLPIGAPVLANNSFARDSSGSIAGFWNGTSLAPIASPIFAALNPSSYVGVGVSQLPKEPTTVAELVRSSTSEYFILDSNKAFKLTSTQVSELGLNTSQFRLISGNIGGAIAHKVTVLKPVIRINTSNSIYLLKNAQRYHILSPGALAEQGYMMSDVMTINSRTASLFPQSNQKIFVSGTLLRIDGARPIYIINSNSTKLYVHTPALMSSFGFRNSEVVNVSAGSVAGYTTTGTIGSIVRSASNAAIWVIDSGGIRREIQAPLQGASGYNLTINSLPIFTERMLARYPMKEKMTLILQAKGDLKVYKIEAGQKRHVTSPSALSSIGYTFNSVRVVSPVILEAFPNGPAIN